MEDWLDIAKEAKGKARGDALAGYTFSGVQVRIDKHQAFPAIEARILNLDDR